MNHDEELDLEFEDCILNVIKNVPWWSCPATGSIVRHNQLNVIQSSAVVWHLE